VLPEGDGVLTDVEVALDGLYAELFDLQAAAYAG